MPRGQRGHSTAQHSTAQHSTARRNGGLKHLPPTRRALVCRESVSRKQRSARGLARFGVIARGTRAERVLCPGIPRHRTSPHTAIETTPCAAPIFFHVCALDSEGEPEGWAVDCRWPEGWQRLQR